MAPSLNPAPLPIHSIREPLLNALAQHQRAVLIAPTGSGKTTQVPQMILDTGLAGADRILVLQPRRVAARTVARRVAFERNQTLGSTIGYQVRFEDFVSPETRIAFMTEGVLLRQLADNPRLNGVAAVLFDEFHERNLLSDAALAMVKAIQAKDRPDLLIAVMSATLEAQPVASYLDDAPILSCDGIAHPVSVRYLTHGDRRPAPELAADCVESILQSNSPGDILIFMPGMSEIHATLNALRTIRSPETLDLIPLHGDLPPADQDRAFQPSPNRRVIVSTNVAETSVTIDGIQHVIDSGLARINRFDPGRGINSLAIEPISRASADQRKGRAGRTAPGTCHRLWSESAHLDRPESNTPEIRRSDLAEVVLFLHSMGIRRAAEFDWLDKPDPAAVLQAERLLVQLGALHPSQNRSEDPTATRHPNRQTDLTAIGETLRRLPLHPRFGRMLVEAGQRRCTPAAALCAALVSGRDLMLRIGREDSHIARNRELFDAGHDSDFYPLMRAFEFARREHFSVEACRRFGIHAHTARQISQTFEQILEVARREGLAPRDSAESTPPAPDALERCILAGFPDQLARRRDRGTLDCDLVGNRTGTLARESVVTHADLVVPASIREIESPRTGTITLLSQATAVRREWLQEMFPHLLSESLEHHFDRTHRRVAAVRLHRFIDLIIHHSFEPETNPSLSARCLARATRAGAFELPLLDHHLRQIIARSRLASVALPGLGFPSFNEDEFVETLTLAFHGLTLAKEAQAAPLQPALEKTLGSERKAWLAEFLPPSIAWTGERPLKLTYPDPPPLTPEENPALDDLLPEAQVRLLDCFQLQEHPRLCEGKVPIRLWLCTPDGKRLESTTDFPGFKSRTYPKLRLPLTRKFPGNPWP